MSDAVWVRGYYGDRYVLVDGREVLELHTEADARRFLEELGEKALEAIDPRALPPGLRADFQASSSREKVEDATNGSTVVQLPDVIALQDALRPRWEQPRGEEWLDEPDDHTYIDCSAPLPSVQVATLGREVEVRQPKPEQEQEGAV